MKAFDPHVSIEKQMKIAPVTGQVAVFFPAEKETSGLRFHLHAPFVPELSRASIKETPANEPLFEQLAGLAAVSLHEVRDLGLLTRGFLSVLPNKQDSIPAHYEKIRTAIIDEMNNKPLTPTHGKSHAPAKKLLQAKATLKSLLSEKDLEFLFQDADEPPLWSVGAAQKNTNADRFLESLKIREWGLEEFVNTLTDSTSQRGRVVRVLPYWVDGPDGEFMEWLSSKPNDWHQQLYALLYSELASVGGLYQFRNSKIVRLFSGEYGVGKECFFPDEGDQDDSDLPRVTAEVYTSGKGKAQQHNARKFLEEIGVRVVGEKELIQSLLVNKYTSEDRALNKRKYVSDLRRFIKFLDKNPCQSEVFEDKRIFFGEDEVWHSASEIFLDAPFLETGLAEYFHIVGFPDNLVALSERYLDMAIDTPNVAQLADKLGAKRTIEIREVSCRGNPDWDDLRHVSGERYTSPIDEDYKIQKFEDFAKTNSKRISALIWHTMMGASISVLKARYQKNLKGGSRCKDSQLVYQLREAAWVPQGEDSFVRPSEASRDALPEGFTFDPGWAWIKAIDFGKEAELESEKAKAAAAEAVEKRSRRAAAVAELGYPPDVVDFAERIKDLPAEHRKRFIEKWERSCAEVELPENEPRNPVRRAQRVGAMAENAPERKTEERTRSVSLGREEVKLEATQYLQQQYVVDGSIICQVCRSAMPFKLDDGSDYFERVEFLNELTRRHHQNYLALCPNHAAMFQHANSTKAFMLEKFLELSGNDLEVILAQKNTTIYFTKTHIADLKRVIEVDRNSAHK